MGSKLGFVALRAGTIGADELIEDTVALCAELGVATADLFVVPCVPLAELGDHWPDDAEIAVLGLRCEQAHPGIDALAERLAAVHDTAVLATFVNDFYQTGGYQLWTTDGAEAGLLVDGKLQLGGASVQYMDVPEAGVALLLGVELDWPRPGHEFAEDLLDLAGRCEGSDLRLVEAGEVLSPPRALGEDEDSLDWNWLSESMSFPMLVRPAQRWARQLQERQERAAEVMAAAGLVGETVVTAEVVRRCFGATVPPALAAAWDAGDVDLLGIVPGTTLDELVETADHLAASDEDSLDPPTGCPYRFVPFALTRWVLGEEPEASLRYDNVALDLARPVANGEFEVVRARGSEIVERHETTAAWLDSRRRLAPMIAVLDRAHEAAPELGDRPHEAARAFCRAALSPVRPEHEADVARAIEWFVATRWFV